MFSHSPNRLYIPLTCKATELATGKAVKDPKGGELKSSELLLPFNVLSPSVPCLRC